MVAPTDSTNEYNGTYQGGQGIGRGYSTLYRDTYTAPNGWRGEGSGMHQGVDIRINRALVKASRGGLVIRADSTDVNGWGGLVVIQAANPYASGYVYLIYAHLSEIHVSDNSTVTTGQVIGRSGGNSNDPGKGAAQGPHLHFQIDKSVNSTSFPSPHTYTYARINSEIDSDYEVMNHTYNPMVFVQGGYRWEFQQNGNWEFWQAANVASSGVSGGALWIDGNVDPWVQRGDGTVYCALTAPCSTQIAADANMYRYVRLDMALNCTSLPIAIYFKTSTENYFSGDKMVPGQPTGPLPPTTIYYMGGHAKWTGVITGLRVDPGADCSQNSAINYIGFIRLVSTSTG
jgi:hypothetical protein